MLSPVAVELGRIFETPGHRVDLGRAALVLARFEYPALDVDSYLKKFDQFAKDAPAPGPDDAKPSAAAAVPGPAKSAAARAAKIKLLRMVISSFESVRSILRRARQQRPGHPKPYSSGARASLSTQLYG